MGFSNWLCANNSKNMLVKIVYPGGRVEFHDRPVLAAEIMLRNQKCIVAHPNVFKQPWAIVAPDTMLCLGQKFYVVPVSTIRKLQRLGDYKNSPPVKSRSPRVEEENESITSPTSWKKVNSPGKNLSKDRFMSPIPESKVKGNNGDDSSEVASSSSSFSSSQTKGLTGKRSKGFATMDNWQPSLESIVEEF